MQNFTTFDYLEMLQRMELLARLIRSEREAARGTGPADDIAQACLQETGLPFSVVQHASPEMLSELLHEGVNFYGRAMILAELLALEAEFNEEDGELAGMVRAQLQAFCLFGESLPALPPEEQAVFRKKMDLLAAKLCGAGDAPYLKQKLKQFGY
jgi:hypothetical protein